jgi:hypothetical protein
MKHTRALIYLAATLITVAIFLTVGMYTARLIDAIYGTHMVRVSRYHVTILVRPSRSKI